MDGSQDVGGNYWGYLINADKTAAPLLEQLCLGLHRILRKEGKGPTDQLSPERLAKFYRSVGGNLDSLFVAEEDSKASAGFSYNKSLSFIYRTLGCFHTLQPSLNAFETPSLPCLTAAGFVRWQTIQLLLCPAEHAVYMQKAVQVYDVLRPDGRVFSRSIPRDAFPEQPDAAMERWHQRITSKLEGDYVKFRNSPYGSPQPQSTDRSDGYFGAAIPEIRQPGRRSRGQEERARSGASSRRNSLPDPVSPTMSPHEHTRPSSAYYADGRRRSVSASRPGYNRARPRSATAGNSVPHHRHESASSQRDGYDRDSRRVQRPSHYARPPPHRQYQATVDDDSSGEEASGEESTPSRRHRSHDSPPRGNYVKRNLLAPVLDLLPGRRRHSSDGSSYIDRDDRKRREDSRSRSARVSPNDNHGRPHQPVHFRQDVFSDDLSTGSDSPTHDPRDISTGRRTAESNYSSGYPTGRESSGSGSDRVHRHSSHTRRSRDKDIPLRVSTVTGVHGRRYANMEPSNAVGGATGPSAGLANQQDPRARYSVAV